MYTYIHVYMYYYTSILAIICVICYVPYYTYHYNETENGYTGRSEFEKAEIGVPHSLELTYGQFS